jgi:tRNA threonylcarbamoyladenosine biosynthesis protein TsaB
MRILSVDTATASCSVGVLDAGRLMAEATSEKKQTHSKHLMKMIDTVVQIAGIRMDEVDLFAATIGPGSFTGIRIGISTVQGFAAALSKPVVGVSSLEALAHQAGSCSYLICPLLDARKGEVYAALYQFEKNGLRRIIEEHVSPLEKILYRIDGPCLFVGNGAQAYEKLIGKRLGEHAMFAGPILGKIRAETVGRIAMQRIQNRNHENLNQLIPRYIRRSDAEIGSARHKAFRKGVIDSPA